MSVTESELRDPALLGEVDLARAAAQEEAGDEEVGAHVGTHIEADTAVTHLFEAAKPGYRGWRWAVTVASAGPATDVTVSEVVLLPGPDALVAPDWVPWENRVQAGDLGVGDLLPTAPDDPRLVPTYVASDDPAVEELALEVGLGRPRVMARPARLEAAARWQHSEFGPRSDMARSAPAHCGTCGFYLPLAGSLRAAFGTCGNEISPADGHVVHAEYGCGAHSEAEVEQVSPVLVANLIYDDAQLDVDAAPAEPTEATAEPAEATAEPAEAIGEAAVSAETGEAALAAAAPRELSGPGPAAELPFPDQEPPASEPVAPIEAVVTAETTIDSPGEAGAPSTLTPWIRPEGAARAGDPATAESASTTAADAPADVPADAPSQGGLLTGGLLRRGGLLIGGLLRNRRAPIEAEASGATLATPDQLPEERGQAEAATSTEAESRTELAPEPQSEPESATEAEAQGEAESAEAAASQLEHASQPEGQTGDATEAEHIAEAEHAADAGDQTEHATEALSATVLASPTGDERATEAASHLQAEHTTEDASQPESMTEGAAAAESPAEGTSQTEGATESTTTAEDLSQTEDEGAIEATSPTGSTPETATETEGANRTEPAGETEGVADTEAPTSAPDEHRPWEPSFRPYWMRSADERRTEGD